MKKIIIIICLFALLLSGCGATEASGSYTEETSDRFELVYDQIDWLQEYYILEDTETGVMYLFVEGDESAGLTVMVDSEGDPLIWRD